MDSESVQWSQGLKIGVLSREVFEEINTLMCIIPLTEKKGCGLDEDSVFPIAVYEMAAGDVCSL